MIARVFVLLALLVPGSHALASQNVVVILDDSGSMQDRLRGDRRVRKIDAAKTALTQVLENLQADAQIGVVVLNGGRRPWIIPFGPLDKSSLNQAIQRIGAKGGTPLGKYMKIGADTLLEARAKQHYGTYKLLIVTDGEAGDRSAVERYLPDIISRGIVVDVIGVDMQRDHSLATTVHTYRRADDRASLEEAIAEVVLSETTADSGMAGESDFELLAGIPNEMATAALAALAEPGNTPIGERQISPNSRQVISRAQAQSQRTAQRFPQPANLPPTNAPPQQRAGGLGAMVVIVLGLACTGVFGLFILMVLFMSQRKRR